MRIAIVSKAFVVGAYQSKLIALAAHDDLTLAAIVPPSWREGPDVHRLERRHTEGYEFIVAPMALNGHYHAHFYPTLGRLLRRLRPDLVHVDEEPYNLATYLAVRAARGVGSRTLFFTWQNLQRAHPPPFSWMEAYVHHHVDGAIAGNRAAAAVLRAKGYRGPLAVIPQFGMDPALFCPGTRERGDAPFTVGYAGRLVEQKGLRVLLDALGYLSPPWRLSVVGSGPLGEEVAEWFAARGLAERLDLRPRIPSEEMPAFYRSLDVLVLPSLTRPNWVEQFGRVLVEAMACGVSVVGSDSGEIPHVVGDAGVIVPEGDSRALAAALQGLAGDDARREELGRRGRERVLQDYTQERIAERTAAFYREVLAA